MILQATTAQDILEMAKTAEADEARHAISGGRGGFEIFNSRDRGGAKGWICGAGSGVLRLGEKSLETHGKGVMASLKEKEIGGAMLLKLGPIRLPED